jgi:hypothetical protein
MNSVIVSFDENAVINVDVIYNHLKKLYPDVKGVKVVKNNNEFADLLSASESSLGFWDNDIDDEVWNNA